MRYKITARAERDLAEIYRHTARVFGHPQAEKYLRELDAVFELVGDRPDIGRAYAARTRQFVHGPHIILYRVREGEVVIGRIFHGAQRS